MRHAGPYSELTLPAARPDAPIVVRFAGVSTLLFDDHETAWMIDGFFSRPSLLEAALGKIGPNVPVIEHTLKRLGSPRLAAVIPIHSHYDHAMDSPVVAMLTDAVLMGSGSTLNIGRGLHAEKVLKVQDGQTVPLGKWRLTFFASRHGPTPDLIAARGNVDTALEPPQHALSWREGQVWLILVEHESGPCMLVSGTPGVPEQAIKGRRADVVFLATGMLGKHPAARDQVWNDLVVNFGPKRVIPIHWDNFFKPLDDEPLAVLPRPIDDFDATMADYRARARLANIGLRMPPLFTPFEPVAANTSDQAVRREAGCMADKPAP